MPAHIGDPTLGIVIFSAVKLAGYCLAAKCISHIYAKSPPQCFKIGLTRTLIGISVGLGAVFILPPLIHQLYPPPPSPLESSLSDFMAAPSGPSQDTLFLLGLIPLRLLEWLALIIIFYDRFLVYRMRVFGVVVVGTVWSFILDIPAIMGFLSVFDFWIC